MSKTPPREVPQPGCTPCPQLPSLVTGSQNGMQTQGCAVTSPPPTDTEKGPPCSASSSGCRPRPLHFREPGDGTAVQSCGQRREALPTAVLSHTGPIVSAQAEERASCAWGTHVYFLLAVGNTVTVRWPPQPSGRTGPILCPCLLGCGGACPSCRDCGLWTFPGQKQRGLFCT